MVKKITLTTIFISAFVTVFAQIDTTYLRSVNERTYTNSIVNSKSFQLLEVPVILAATGLAYKTFDSRFNATRNNFIPKFSQSYDDYTQYLPAAVMLGLKFGNVHDGGRSSWAKMLTADGFSIAIMAGVVNGLKHVTNVRRPGNGAYNSFPSGHTATAFMTATMLHKEYGQESPWYSVGAYAMATTTGVTRILNNKHWASDVFVGAAIGIVSVELGYLLSDLIFKKEKSKYAQLSTPTFGHNYRPSFIGLYTGVSLNMGKYRADDGRHVTIESGNHVGVEGAWFITPYIGVGGLFTASTSTLNIEESQPLEIPNNMDMLSASGGVYFSYPLNPVWRIGTKALVGVNYLHKELPTLFDARRYNVDVQTGVSISYLANEHLGFKLYTDYNHTPQLILGRASNELIFGVSIDLIF